MPKASLLEKITASPGEMTFHMIEGILEDPAMKIDKKLAVMKELCLERIFFDSPEQAVKIISGLADIISSDPHAEVRAAALEAMEHMIDLEKKTEAKLDKAPVDWRKLNVLLRKARKQAEADIVPIASRRAPPAPESVQPLPPQEKGMASEDEAPEMHAVSNEEESAAAEEAELLTVQEDAVAAIRRANLPPGPSPNATPVPASASLDPEPPIMKFLRAVADTDDEESIRALAKKILERIEGLTSLGPMPSSAPAPALTEG